MIHIPTRVARVAVAVFLLGGGSASAAALDPTTLMSQFALISLGNADTTMQSHIEGRSYVGGDMKATSFYSNSDGGADVSVGDVSGTMIVGGNVIGNLQGGGSGSIVVGGSISVGNTSGRPTTTGVGANLPGGVPVAEVASLFSNLSAKLAGYDTNTAFFSGDSNNMTFHSGAGDANGLAVLKLTPEEATAILGSNALMTFNVQSGVTLVINVASPPANITAKVNADAPTVLFNFSAATSLIFDSQAFQTSILAPLAVFSSPNGGTRGSMVVGSLGAMKGEIRSFVGSTSTFGGQLPSPPPPEVPLPASALLLMGGLGALGFARRRRAA